MENTTQQQPEVLPPAESGGAAKLIRQVNRFNKRRFSAEDKIRIVLEGFRKEQPVSDLCRLEKVSPAVYYSWTKQFMEGGKTELRGDTLRSATRDEVEVLKKENAQLKALAGEQALELSLFKKRLNW
jgi:transposase